MDYQIYARDYLRLTEDFKAYDSQMHTISKREFLKALATGNYLPLRLISSPADAWVYQLYKIKQGAYKDARQIIQQLCGYVYQDFLQEGKKMPPFKFVDLKGNIYTNANTKGKIMVLKSWFIHCQACNEEMPELNNLTTLYKNRKDVIFVSIAFDSKQDLIAFQKKKNFQYAVASVPEDYIEKILSSGIYPTHWIINKQGVIVKRTNDPEEMISALNKQAVKEKTGL